MSAPVEAAREKTVVEPGVPADQDALVAIEQRCFSGDRLSPRSLARFLRDGRNLILVARRAGTVTGYALFLLRRGSRRARLYSLAVDPGHRGRGIAGALLASGEALARRAGCDAVRLEVRVDNAGAITLYRNAGYRIIGERSDYYEDGATALRLEKLLGENAG